MLDCNDSHMGAHFTNHLKNHIKEARQSKMKASVINTCALEFNILKDNNGDYYRLGEMPNVSH